MQFNLVNNNEMLIFMCIWVHDGAVCLAVSGLRHTCTGSSRSLWSQCSGYLEPHYEERCVAFALVVFSGSVFLIFLLPCHYSQ